MGRPEDSEDTEEIVALPAELVERFALVKILGAGAYGQVMLARDRELGRQVAVKLLRPEGLTDGNALPRFLREARLMGRIRSDRVAEVYDSGSSEDGMPWLVSQYIAGGSLKEMLKTTGGSLVFGSAARLFLEILEGLDACHEQGILHRDLKPDNILLTPDGHAVLSDFGLGRSELDTKLTATGQVVGTPAYMAPEQMEGKGMDGRGDVYAAGLIFCEMVTGKVPMIAKTMPETYFRRRSGLRRGFVEQGWPISSGVEDLLLSVLDPKPENRPASAGELHEALSEAFRSMGEKARELRLRKGALPEGKPVDPGAVSPSDSLVAAPVTGSAPRRAPLRPGLALVGAAILLVGLVGGSLLGRSSGANTVAPDPAAHALWEELVRVVKELDSSEPIVRCLASSREMDADVARELWMRARSAYREIISRARLVDLLPRLDPAGAGIEEANRLGRLLLLERLLERTGWDGVAPLYQGLENPQVGRYLDRLYQVREVPAMTGQGMSTFRFRDAYRPWLAEKGRKWRALRSLESLIVLHKGREKLQHNLRLTAPDGEPWYISGKEVPGFLVESMNKGHDRDWIASSPRRFEIDLEGGGKDLVLIAVTFGVLPTHTIEIELLGREETLRLRIPTSDQSRWGKGGKGKKRWGVGVRVPARLVPAGLRKLRLQVVSLQSVGTPEFLAMFEEMVQLLEGEPPALFFEGAPPR